MPFFQGGGDINSVEARVYIVTCEQALSTSHFIEMTVNTLVPGLRVYQIRNIASLKW